MSFTEKIAGYRRLQQENKAWSLLCAANAPLILGFLSTLFSEERDVPISSARAILQEHLKVWRDQFGIKSETDPSNYLRQWIGDGYIRETENILSLTDAGQSAIRFADGLGRRDLGATASHLRIVQDAVRDLFLGLTGDIEERRKILLAQKFDIEYALDQLAKGRVETLTKGEQRERIREVVILARQLAGDFRHIEDEIRRIDQELRQQMIEKMEERGEVLGNLLDEEDLLSKSPAGQAFENFFELLCDLNREVEFREQLRVIATEGEGATAEDRKFLSHLVRELTSESQRIFKRRHRTWESLRAFVANRNLAENKAIEKLLNELFKIGVSLKDAPGFNIKTPVEITIGTGRAKIASPGAIAVQQAPEEIIDKDIIEHPTSNELTSDELSRFRTVRIRAVAEKMRRHLRDAGSLTLGELAAISPINEGLEEVVAQIRIAHALGGIALGGEQVIEFKERDGRVGRARIPTLQLSADDFPLQLHEMPL